MIHAPWRLAHCSSSRLARDGQHSAHRELVRRRHEGQARAAVGRKARRSRPHGIDGHRQRLRARGLEAVARHPIARIFEDEGVTRIQQQPGAQVQALLRPVHDEDLVHRAGQATRAAQVAVQRTAQALFALGLAVGRLSWR